MLPSHVAENIRKQVLFYLQSTFAFADQETERAFERFLLEEGGLFKGPWVSLRLPFRPAPEGAEIPLDVKVGFHPFQHQWLAWRRLSSRDDDPRSVIVTTGTGSGKTECFLLPILDHCLRAKRQGQRGIKAIVLYPMNALAADQEKRFAATIWNDEALREAGIRVGNFTGRYDAGDPGASMASGTQAMGEDHGISHHGTQLETPPDILLTNYKMLDFLLMRPRDQRLWRFNDPGVLRYLVLDELHTYDGAQGSDVACLVRRLKERLEIPKGKLCVVGTSATLEIHSDKNRLDRDDEMVDAKETPEDRLARFAEVLFQEEIPVDAVIAEDRLAVEEIVRAELRDVSLPGVEDCEPLEEEDAYSYAVRQARLWGAPDRNAFPDDEAWDLALGDWLKGCKLFKGLLDAFTEAEERGEDPLPWGALVSFLSDRELELSQRDAETRHAVLGSFFSLISQAKETRSGVAYPLVPSQVQLWIRELRRLGRLVTEEPAFGWVDEPPSEYHVLPAFHCSECGESGWAALSDSSQDAVIGARGVDGTLLRENATEIYRGWFGAGGGRWKSPHFVLLSPWRQGEEVLEFEEEHLCPASLVLRKGKGPCPLTGDARSFRVAVSRPTKSLEDGRVVGDPGCPRCGSKQGIFFIGSQAATLASVAIDEMFGSLLNEDPKLLAFTDSVQDASHRAAFFTARTYRFTFRTALQRVIDEAGEEGLPLPETGERLLAYWSQEGKGRPGSLREALAVLMPPDLKEYPPFLEFRNSQGDSQPDPAFLEEMRLRLTWEATSEFGVMKTHGRTLQRMASSCLGWDPSIVAATVQKVRERIEGIDPMLVGVSEDPWRVWIYGLLHRYSERGALDHPYLEHYAKLNYWGKNPFGRTVGGRETYPSMHRYMPSLLITQPQAKTKHEHLLAPSRAGRSPWPILWTRKALDRKVLDETSILDLLSCWLEAGVEGGLLHPLHQDGARGYYALSGQATRVISGGICLECSETRDMIVRPEPEASLWEGAPSLSYFAKVGRYAKVKTSQRQSYYQRRYRRGALRRVVAQEHTGILPTESREELEKAFSKGEHGDDPNVLTCTSTLEMGIDIGDLSSTMLCSIPPNTASYLQRIGRAGRASGTALIVSIVNHRPHDLFFYARPWEILKGRVEPPGCWLDASAVLSRQYLAFCFDQGTKEGILTSLPPGGRAFVDDLSKTEGLLRTWFGWIMGEEDRLRSAFLQRVEDAIGKDTRERFLKETATERLMQAIEKAGADFEARTRELANARTRLRKQLDGLAAGEEEARKDIERELRIVGSRTASLNRVTFLEILTDQGLLPNYAFPERGVRFYGSVYNPYRKGDVDHLSVELTRPAGPALRELAPGNTFYTRARRFEIQQITLGSPQEPLVETWTICGRCGHMRRPSELDQPGSVPSCPQCGHEGDERSQTDVGQRREFLEYAQSQALSYMNHYESLAGDRSEEREQRHFHVIRSFDLTVSDPLGAVGEDTLPFGVEYRNSLILRDVNVGPQGGHGAVAFGLDEMAPEEGFQVCRSCGVVLQSDDPKNEAQPHRRSCPDRRRFEKMRQEGRSGNPFHWENIYLYRELQSEALRLLLPSVDPGDLQTLTACLYLGLRIRFRGDPTHLIVTPQVQEDVASGVKKQFLVVMDAVPGGTGYLKTLYEEKDERGRQGEGIIDCLRKALHALEHCPCGRMSERETNGCYRCLRAYHLQYSADQISRKRGIDLLREIVRAADKRTSKDALDQISVQSLYDSELERRFVQRLKEYVEAEAGRWEKTLIRGRIGFRFRLREPSCLWELELQRDVGPGDGVAVPSRPDFLLRCDDENVLPVAIFTDGFQFHVFPETRLADDFRKRRSIAESGQFRVWSISWDDLVTDEEAAAQISDTERNLVCARAMEAFLKKCEAAVRRKLGTVPSVERVLGNGFQQLKAFLESPDARGWETLTSILAHEPLRTLVGHRTVSQGALKKALLVWSEGDSFKDLQNEDGGELVYCERLSLGEDWVSFCGFEDTVSERRERVSVRGRLPDGQDQIRQEGFPLRWRRFLACMNLYQFCRDTSYWTTSQASEGSVALPEEGWTGTPVLSDAWQDIVESVVTSLKPYVLSLASKGGPLPEVEYFLEDCEEDLFAELAWPEASRPRALLAGEQAAFAHVWRERGWEIVDPHVGKDGG